MSLGVYIVNLGSPDSPTTSDVRTYLREFLSDSRVIDVPKVIQQMVLNLFILPFRPKQSAEAYHEIWTDEGSPLVVSTLKQRDLLQERLDIPVAAGMRYGTPSTRDGLEELRKKGVTKVLLIPLYPHYAMSSFETAVVKVKEELIKMGSPMELVVQAPYYEADDYIDALVSSSMEQMPEDYDMLLFSYHSIPERHLFKPDPANHCLTKNCCETPCETHKFCYKAQVMRTTRRFVEQAGIPDDKWTVAFQSRLGRDPWLLPVTADAFEELPGQGHKRIAVVSASFISDCLETLEELDMEGQESFMESGGEEYTAVRCLNQDSRWIDVLERMVNDFKRGETDEAVLARTAENDKGFAAWKRRFYVWNKGPENRVPRLTK